MMKTTTGHRSEMTNTKHMLDLLIDDVTGYRSNRHQWINTIMSARQESQSNIPLSSMVALPVITNCSSSLKNCFQVYGKSANVKRWIPKGFICCYHSRYLRGCANQILLTVYHLNLTTTKDSLALIFNSIPTEAQLSVNGIKYENEMQRILFEQLWECHLQILCSTYLSSHYK